MPLERLQASLERWTPGRARPADPLAAISAAWPSIVGPAVAAHSAPLEISGNALVIATRSSAWSQQLQFLSVAILKGIGAAALERPIERLTFRSGLLRTSARSAASGPAARGRERAPGAEPEEACDLEDALERLRRRVSSLRRRAPAHCAHCGAPLELAGDRVCAPCTGAAENARALQVERLVYLAPWLEPGEMREQLPGLSAAEFERARRSLLQRWWLVLERARRAGKLSASGLERHVASSYVLLQSRLSPDRVTPAVARNLLGPELEALLWPHAADKAKGGDSSKNESR